MELVCARYDNPAIYVTENGFAGKGEGALKGDAALNDDERVSYLSVSHSNTKIR
jgi:beta-glucosidase/6-phospho-beta-glucosidase/beta-galactosidase